MSGTEIPPLHDWHRHYPTANRIAYDLAGDPSMLRHRTRTLVGMVMPTWRVSKATAMKAISIARKAAGEVPRGTAG